MKGNWCSCHWLRQVSGLGIATGYGPEDPGIKFRGGGWCEFSLAFQVVLEPTLAPVQWLPDLFPAVKWPELLINHPFNLAPSYTLLKPLALRGLLQGDLYFYLHLVALTNIKLDNYLVTAFGIVQYIVKSCRLI